MTSRRISKRCCHVQMARLCLAGGGWGWGRSCVALTAEVSLRADADAWSSRGKTYVRRASPGISMAIVERAVTRGWWSHGCGENKIAGNRRPTPFRRCARSSTLGDASLCTPAWGGGGGGGWGGVGGLSSDAHTHLTSISSFTDDWKSDLIRRSSHENPLCQREGAWTSHCEARVISRWFWLHGRCATSLQRTFSMVGCAMGDCATCVRGSRVCSLARYTRLRLDLARHFDHIGRVSVHCLFGQGDAMPLGGVIKSGQIKRVTRIRFDQQYGVAPPLSGGVRDRRRPLLLSR